MNAKLSLTSPGHRHPSLEQYCCVFGHREVHCHAVAATHIVVVATNITAVTMTTVTVTVATVISATVIAATVIAAVTHYCDQLPQNSARKQAKRKIKLGKSTGLTTRGGTRENIQPSQTPKANQDGGGQWQFYMQMLSPTTKYWKCGPDSPTQSTK